jgi:hypothetical protein
VPKSLVYIVLKFKLSGPKNLERTHYKAETSGVNKRRNILVPQIVVWKNFFLEKDFKNNFAALCFCFFPSKNKTRGAKHFCAFRELELRLTADSNPGPCKFQRGPRDAYTHRELSICLNKLKPVVCGILLSRFKLCRFFRLSPQCKVLTLKLFRVDFFPPKKNLFIVDTNWNGRTGS